LSDAGDPVTRTRFVILCLGRSGSTHLQSLLDSHSQVRCFHEVLSPRVPPAEPGFIHSPHASVVDYVRDLFAGLPERVAGFKLPMGSLRAHPEAVELFRDRELRVIRLSRTNLLAQLVSRRLLAETRVAHSIYGSYGDATVRLDPRGAVQALEHMEADERKLDELASASPTHRITYEELSAGRGLEELQRFLGVHPEPLRSWFTKMRTRPLSETVQNWDDVAGRLRRTRFAALLEATG
jgi:Sulfotransferase family